ncbi:PLAT/LH2 domain-containing protein [Streptomyces goshikiensis]|uniref:PLAT/LH2 domain-containing protein n=1 Tax=Streptomyces goshikiensis TaxID=1942 RepID=UPI00365A4DEB
MFRRTLAALASAASIVLAGAFATPVQAQAASVDYKVTIATAKVAGSGTDGDVQAEFTNAAGKKSGWYVLDKPHYNDFENGDRDTYALALPESFGTPVSFQLWQGGGGEWAIESVEFARPDGVDGRWNVENGVIGYFYIDADGPTRTEGYGNEKVHFYHRYSPEWKITWHDHHA